MVTLTSMAERSRTRAIARDAVRAELSQVAFELTREHGFHNVTVDDMAAAAGVSRSTLLRYFGSKEEVVLSAFDDHGVRFAEALRARPPEEDDWTALCRSLEAVLEYYYLENPAGALSVTKFVRSTPALSERQATKRGSWRPAFTAALAARAGIEGEVPVGLEVRVAAGLDCMGIAIERWAESDGELDLLGLLAEGFAALASLGVAGSPGRTATQCEAAS
jgi:AcrR family transcriptional regulator